MADHMRVARLAVLLIGSTLAAAAPPPPAKAPSLGPLPAQALSLPAGTQMLTGLDVRAFVASPLYKRAAQPGGPLRPTAFNELTRVAGIDAERDLDQLVSAHGREGEFVILAIGRLDRARIEAAWKARPRQQPGRSLAFLSARVLAIGSTPWIDVVSGKTPGARLRSNAATMALVAQLPAAATFWLISGREALEKVSAESSKSQAAMGPPLGLPPLKSVVASGDVAPVVSLSVAAEALDEKAARNLTDTVNGFIALASLQAQRKPALKDLASAVSVTAQGASVRLTGRLTDEMIAALIPRPAATASPTAATR